MKGYFYKNTKTTIPNWENDLHESQPLGYAYETDSHFVHFYGKEHGLNIISVGLTAIQGKNGTLMNWITTTFGAEKITPLKLPIGQTVSNIWRPSLYYDQEILKALEFNVFEQRSAEQALRVLIEKLDDLLLYIEPNNNGLKAYGHKTRELLILTCTEVENVWVSILSNLEISPQKNNSYTTNDYVKLLSIAYLNEFEISFKNYDTLRKFSPFLNWDKKKPTQSLAWYNAYNKTKHNRNTSFNEATLENVLYAISASIIMFCVKFSPFSLIHNNNTLTSLINQHFNISLKDSDPSTYYIPKLELPNNIRKDLFIYDSYKNKNNLTWEITKKVNI